MQESDTVSPSDVWDELRGEKGMFHAWSCVRGASDAVAALIADALKARQKAVDKGHAHAEVAIRFQWGVVANREKMEFQPHVSVSEFESVVSRLGAFQGWGCAHAERARYVVRHRLSSPATKRPLVVTTTSTVSPSPDCGNVCPAHGCRTEAPEPASFSSSASAGGEWKVSHAIVHELRSVLVELVNLPSAPCLRVSAEMSAPVPSSVERTMTADMPLEYSMISAREFWEGGVCYSVKVAFKARGRVELDERMKKRSGMHTLELSADPVSLGPLLDAKGRDFCAADLLMKAASMFSWPFVPRPGGKGVGMSVIGEGQRPPRENLHYFSSAPETAEEREAHLDDELHSADEEAPSGDESEEEAVGGGRGGRGRRKGGATSKRRRT